MSILATGTSGGGSWLIIILYVVIIIGFMYFLAIKPQKKQEKKQKEVMDSVEVGDSVLTTSGFYGMVIDVTEDTVIVEFGGNKNCRIPMQKQAIVDVEKANVE
jgi:preprotein translocase subunit YajC